MKVNGKDDIPYMKWKKKTCARNHQPDLLYLQNAKEIYSKLVYIYVQVYKTNVETACCNLSRTASLETRRSIQALIFNTPKKKLGMIPPIYGKHKHQYLRSKRCLVTIYCSKHQY